MNEKLQTKIRNEFSPHHQIRPAPAYRQFPVGTQILFGNHTDPWTVTDFSPLQEIYLVALGNNELALPWYKLRPLDHQPSETELADPDNIWSKQITSSIADTLLRIEHAGVDFAPDYQRGLVWTREQKEALIQTIFDRGSIGTLVFNARDDSTNRELYEIIDGKQRLSTLHEFQQDGFTIKGLLHSELHPRDKTAFKQHHVQVFILQDAPQKDIYRFFLRINRAGTPIDTDHINYVKTLLAESEKTNQEA